MIENQYQFKSIEERDIVITHYKKEKEREEKEEKYEKSHKMNGKRKESQYNKLSTCTAEWRWNYTKERLDS